MFRALIDSTVVYPPDAVSTERLTAAAARTRGIVYIRTTRPKTPVIYPNTEEFPIGGSKVLRASPCDRFAVVAAGILVHESLAAWEALNKRGIPIRVIDAYSVKPLDASTLSSPARPTECLIVVEDHALNSGLGDAVAAAWGDRASPSTRHTQAAALGGGRPAARPPGHLALRDRAARGTACGVIVRRSHRQEPAIAEHCWDRLLSRTSSGRGPSGARS